MSEGTASPGASDTGLPIPELAGIGATPKVFSCSSAGVSGKSPGVLCFSSAALDSVASVASVVAAAPAETCQILVVFGFSKIHTSMLLNVLRQQDIIHIVVPVLLLRRSMIKDPFAVHHELVIYLLIGIGQVDLFLPDIADFVQLFGLAPVIKGTSDVHILRIRMRPVDSSVSIWYKSLRKLVRPLVRGFSARRLRTHHLKRKLPILSDCVLGRTDGKK